MEHPLIVIEKAAWEELTGLVKSLAIEVKALIKDRTMPEILTHKEAAQYLGYSPRRLYDLKGIKIAFSQHGKKITYRLGDLDAFLKEHRIEKGK